MSETFSPEYLKPRAVCVRCGEFTDRHSTAKYCFACAKIKNLEDTKRSKQHKNEIENK